MESRSRRAWPGRFRGELAQTCAEHAVECRVRVDDVRERRERRAELDGQHELAHDFATVFKILRDAVPADPEEDDPRGTLINYAFNVRNRSYNSPLLAPYQPDIVPGLVGFDFGVRTSEPANVALEIVVELRDRRGDRVAERGQTVRLLEPPEAVISGGAP